MSRIIATRKVTRAELPESGPRGTYTKAMWDRAQREITRSSSGEDQTVIFENYMRVLAKAFVRRIRRDRPIPDIQIERPIDIPGPRRGPRPRLTSLSPTDRA